MGTAIPVGGRIRGAAATATAALDAALSGARAEARQRRGLLATGFDVLDTTLGGGLGATDLLLLGGVPGAGKTVAALQMARHAARQGHGVLYVCYEHRTDELLSRLLLLELAEHGDEFDPERELLGEAVRASASRPEGLQELAVREPQLAAATDRLREYSDRLWLVAASGAHTDVDGIGRLVAEHLPDGGLLVVDYLQKVAVIPEPPDEAEKVRRITEGLKDLALRHEVSVMAISAADRAALDASRLRLHHLRGSSALAYEADVVVILNDKFRTVAKVHLTYDTVRAESFRRYVVFSIEKNRRGPAPIDLEFRKDFSHYRFDPHGGYVRERLVDERLTVE